MIPRSAWLAALFCVLLIVPASGQRKQQPAVGVVPPQPVQLNVKVRREGKTEIPLSINGVAGEPLKFLIRTPPVVGKASDPRSTGRETAVTVYEPPADLSITADHFLYAVQSGAGVSAPVEVFITIVDQPPQLTNPDTLEFPAVRTGSTSSKLLEISNSGGGMLVGEVVVEAPWRIEGKTGYRLGAGDVAIYKLIFAPAVGGTFESVARFTSDPTHSTTLKGVGETSVNVSPTELVLQQLAGDPVRAGTLELTNQTDEPRNLELKTSERLQVPARVALPPRGKMSVPVQIAASDVLPLKEEIRILAPDLELRVPVKAAAAGAVLRAVQASIAFGRVPLKPASSVRFEMENIGGTQGEIQWTIGAPFHTNQNSVLLLPGERRGFDLEIEGKAPGKYRAWLQCKAGGQSFEIPVEAEVTAGVGPQKSPAMAAAGSSPSTGAPAPESPEPAAPDARPAARHTPAVPRDWFGDRFLPAGVQVTGLQPTAATIEWPTSLSAASQFRVDLRQFSFAENHTLVATWLELEGLDIKQQGSRYTVSIRDLQPAQPWTVRVRPLDASGTPDERLFAIDFKTPPKSSYVPHVSPLGGLFAVLALLLGWQAVARWRPRNEPR